MSACQPALFDVQPLVDIEHIPHESLDDRFARWIKANPQVLTAFIHFADQARLRGRTRIGGKAIAERLRWEAPISTRGDDFKINNSFISRLARAAVTKRPDLIELFEFRELRS